MSTYVVDSNFFIQAHRASYPLDVAKSFWEKIIQLAAEEKIISIDKVKNEIYQNDDELKLWCKANLPKNFFKDSSELISSYRQVVNWAISRNVHYLPKAINEFLGADEADAWLVAYSLNNNCTITTYEISQPERKNKIKIPDACDSIGVAYVNTIGMFRQLGIQF